MDGQPFKLQIKIGQHEFSAEGDQATVERQFEVWRGLISTVASAPVAPVPPAAKPGVPAEDAADPDAAAFAKIFRRDTPGVVSLSVLPQGTDLQRDAGLLLLLGRRIYQHEQQVTGQRLLTGLKESGVPVDRADRMFGDYMERYLIRAGVHRAVRYRLTNPGMEKARELARELAGRVA